VNGAVNLKRNAVNYHNGKIISGAKLWCGKKAGLAKKSELLF
jgi:hypothetical protein